MKSWRIVAVMVAVIAVASGLLVGGVALAQSPTPTITPQQSQGSATAWVGVGLVDLNEKVAARLSVSQTTGVAISRVVANSPAATAGLKTKDIITAVDGKSVSKADEVVAAVKAKKPGDAITFTVLRDGVSSLIKVTTSESPTAVQGNAGGRNRFGFQGKGNGSGAEPKATPGAGNSDKSGPLGGLLDGLRNLPQGQLFGHMFGWQFKVQDNNNNIVTVKEIPGTVVAASKDSLMIKPNDSTESGGPYAITSDTKVLLGGNASVDALKAGDQVIVITTDGKTALAVTQGTGRIPMGRGAEGWGPMRGFGSGHPGMNPGQKAPATGSSGT